VIILFGMRRRSARLAMVFLMCGYCNTPAAHPLTRVRKYFTLFFVPVLPLGTKYYISCTMCGRTTQITQEAADQYVASANQGSATADGATAPPPPPPRLGADVDPPSDLLQGASTEPPPAESNDPPPIS
jgi:zinc-ribbon family